MKDAPAIAHQAARQIPPRDHPPAECDGCAQAPPEQASPASRRGLPEEPLADAAAEALAEAVAERALALFESREMYCAEAVLCALSEGLGGGLERESARGLAMGFGQGLGKAGCVCGALGGAVMGASFFLARELSPDEVRGASKRLHAVFTGAHGSSCCRVLTRTVRDDPKGHFRQCAVFTRHGALLAAREVLGRMPRLATGAGLAAVSRRRSRLGSLLRRLADRLG
ncbi:hypothetical protein NNJEOMEG_00920 [Fundidesulfovibrio magnetotacticus]|uniref:C_GCAxxG_C_C family redox protein n=1 Tax=Fundidesulfovibrio magnetotacticus TaxID=2730080 RepID=A0A6V8LRB0_9BACT|nr:C-GCAxxG-C-C family protein [Fundidesulfovibrio magnetotacticus]GFK93091.1 hypothetical protein NNJEOMEG_00920 [Fundidesulfovibrio magnetotacticus]